MRGLPGFRNARAAADSSGERLRVMTYNTHAGADRHSRLDLEAIARTIERCEPDVVALQEVDRHYGRRSGYVDQPAWYAEHLGMDVLYGPNLHLAPDVEGNPDREYGLALLTRRPMHERLHRPFAFVSGEPRGFVQAMIDWQGITVRVVTTHLSVSAAANRRAEMRELADHLEGIDGPVVVAGDFNARARAPEMSRLRGSLVDAWQAGRGPGRTCFGKRIDHIWVSGELRPVRSWVVHSKASDHFPVVTDLVLAGMLPGQQEAPPANRWGL